MFIYIKILLLSFLILIFFSSLWYFMKTFYNFSSSYINNFKEILIKNFPLLSKTGNGFKIVISLITLVLSFLGFENFDFKRIWLEFIDKYNLASSLKEEIKNEEISLFGSIWNYFSSISTTGKVLSGLLVIGAITTAFVYGFKSAEYDELAGIVFPTLEGLSSLSNIQELEPQLIEVSPQTLSDSPQLNKGVEIVDKRIGVQGNSLKEVRDNKIFDILTKRNVAKVVWRDEPEIYFTPKSDDEID